MNAALARAELARFGVLSYAGFILLIWPLVLVWLLGEPGAALLERPAALPLITVLAAWPIPIYCFLEDPRTRIFELSLPVAPRELHLTRLGVLGGVMFAPIAGALCSTLAWLTIQGQSLAPVAGEAVDIIGSTALLAMSCVYFQPSPDPADRGYLRELLSGGALLGVGVVLLPGPWLGIACTAAAAVLFPYLLRGAPRAAQAEAAADAAAPVPLDAASPQAEVAEPARRFGFSPLHWLVLRTTVLRPGYLGAVATFVVAGSMALLSGPVMSVAVLPFVFFEAHASSVLRAFARLDPVPISRSLAAAYVIGPSLFALFVLAGLATFPLPSWGLVRDDISVAREAPFVHVPGFAWRRHRGMEAPVITSPWAEAVQGEVRRIPDAELALYNPYDVTPATSLRMLGWQLARAAREIYGVEIPPEKLLAHVWAQDAKKGWNPNAQLQGTVGDLQLAQDVSFRGVIGPSAAARFGMEVAWLALLFGASALFTFASAAPPPERSQWWRRWVLVLPALALALYALGIGVLTFWLGSDDLGLLHGVFVAGPLHRALGASAAVWLALGALALAAILAFIALRIRTSELGWVATGNRPG